jgi:hypothetical protein
MSEYIQIDDYFEKLISMKKAGDDKPSQKITEELIEYVQKISDGEVEFNDTYFENQLILIYCAGLIDAFEVGPKGQLKG